MEKPSSSGQQGQFLHRFFNRVDCDYTSHYCEENIWRLCDAIRKHQPKQLQYARVVFISNDIKQMPLWRQKIAPSVNECIFWDYHVILLITAQDRGQTIVYDFDTTLPFPVPVDEYWQLTFRPNSFNFPDDYRRKFRVISADEFLQRFSSDRRHMKAANGDWLAPPPGWSCIYSQEFGHSLAQFIDMREEFYGSVIYDEVGFFTTFIGK